MRKTIRNPNRVAVAKSLRELAILFGKKLPDRNECALREQGADETLLTGKPKVEMLR